MESLYCYERLKCINQDLLRIVRFLFEYVKMREPYILLLQEGHKVLDLLLLIQNNDKLIDLRDSLS
jgi:hypothetical protein